MILGGDPMSDSSTELRPVFHGTILAAAAGAGATFTIQPDDGSYVRYTYDDPWRVGQFKEPILDLRTLDYDGDGQPDVLLLGTMMTVQKGLLGPTVELHPSVGDGQFLDFPGERHPLLVVPSGWIVNNQVGNQQIGWLEPGVDPIGRATDYQLVPTGLSGNKWTTKSQDIAGDGSRQLAIFDDACEVHAGTFLMHKPALHQIQQIPTGVRCEDLFFADVAPKDGRPDLIFEVRNGNEPSTHWLLAHALPDGSYEAQMAEPSLRRKADGTLAPMPPGSKWVATADMNGDGIDDLVLWTPDGAQIAFAEVVQK
jgi:hypothetical protein